MEQKQVFLPKNKIPQQLDRLKLRDFNFHFKDYFENLNKQNENPFILQDGCPYANNDFHMGHLMNKILKDVRVKFGVLDGEKMLFQLGWDCHGLPIELRVDGELDKCPLVVKEYSTKQKETANLFGVYGFGDDYFTMNEDFKQREIDLFNQLLAQGDIYKDKKIVWYSPSLGTVLANSQINYKKVEVEGLYVLLGDFLCFTTTEWTLAANQAVCLNPNIQYVKTNEGWYCGKFFAVQNDIPHIDVSLENIPTTYNGKPVLYDNFVTETGTGIVHLCGGHGEIDNEILKKNGIEGKTVCEPKQFAVHLNTYNFTGTIYKKEIITHDYPFDDRTDNPVYQFLTEQFFVKINKEKIYQQVKNIKMTNKQKETFLSFLLSRPEWCISRQRKWGVQIPKSEDILDVWFDSGCVFLMNEQPADLYIEGTDQYRGWFQSSTILSSLVNRQCTKKIVAHGFIVDEYKEKLSKSKGNFTAVKELYDKYNPDVLRLWVCMANYKVDLVFSEESINNAVKHYFKFRNYLRYFVNNLHIEDDSPSTYWDNSIDSLQSILEKLTSEVKSDYANIEYRLALDKCYNFLSKYSSTLTEDIKNEFYESDLDSNIRKKYEKEFRLVLDYMIKLLYPVIPFLCAELQMSLSE